MKNMATDDSSDLSAFIQFANAQLETDKHLTLPEALDKWWETHPFEVSQEESEEMEALVQEALDDLAAGEKGIPMDEFMAQLANEFGLKPPPKRT